MNNNLLDNIVFYLFLLLFFVVSLVPFNILENKTASIPVHYIFVGGTVFVLVIISWFRDKTVTEFNNWLLFLVLGFSLSLITSIDRVYTIRTLGSFLLRGIGIAVIAERMIKDKIKLTVVSLLLCASVVSMFGLLELFFGWHPYPKPKEYVFFVIMSTIGNPLVLGAYLIMFFPLSIWFMENNKYFIKCLPFFIILFGIICSYSRTSWIVLFVITIMYFSKKEYLRKLFKNRIYVVLLVLIFVVAYFLLNPQSRRYFCYKCNLKYSSGSLIHRAKSYITTWKIFKEYPMFGVGMGNYPKVHRKYLIEGVDPGTETQDNMYLRILSDTGIVGTGIFFVFIIYWLKRFWQYRDEPLIWSIFLALSGFLINQLSADLFYWLQTNFTFWLIFGLGVKLIMAKENNCIKLEQ